jgi:transcriptional regulator NrdR family protein
MAQAYRCKSCGCPESKVAQTYAPFKAQQLVIIRRRRVCRHCGLSFFTREIEEREGDPKADKRQSEG